MQYIMAMRALIISAIVLVAVVMGLSIVTPTLAIGPPSGTAPMFLNPNVGCDKGERNSPSLCFVVVDANRSGKCDAGDHSILIPQEIARTFPTCPI